MPQGKFVKVFAVSSEDAKFPATNLINQKGKWKCETAGEESIFVVLKLEKPHLIIGVDIINEHSALVEILVGKSNSDPIEYKTILQQCSLMTLIESRNSANCNRVRCFTKNTLVESVAQDKWDLIKFKCSQPFAQHVQYGLSVVTIHVKEESKNNDESDSSFSITKQLQEPDLSNNSKDVGIKPNFIGQFKLRRESSDSDDEPNMFQKWKQSKNEFLSTAAAIRAASASTSALSKQIDYVKPIKMKTPVSDKNKDNNNVIKDRNRADLLFDKDDDRSNEKLERRISEDKNRLNREKNNLTTGTKKDRNYNEKDKQKHNTSDNKFKKFLGDEPKSTAQAKPTKIENEIKTPPAKKPKLEKEIQYKPFNRLLQDVSLVISGIQNPERAILRKKAIELGATYKPDWDNTCTHLICAFKNTPKYNQVKGKGKIVTSDWITECHSCKKRLPWRRYALDKSERKKPESDEEVSDISLQPKPSSSGPMSSLPSSNNEVPSSPERNLTQDILTHYDISDSKRHTLSSNDELDTDDDIQAALKKQTLQKSYQEISTEDENLNKRRTKGESDEPFFKSLKFFIAKDIDNSENSKIINYIKMYKGEISTSMENSDYIIAKTHSETYIYENSPVVVSPEWIYECNDMECLVPPRRYIIK